MNEFLEPYLQPWQMRKVLVQFQKITLTYEMLHSAGTLGIGFNKEQLRLLGVPLPPKKGWLTQLIGTEVDQEVWDKVMKLKGIKGKRTRRSIITGQDNLI